LKRLCTVVTIRKSLFLFLTFLCFFSPVSAFAFPVDPLPEDNLIQNPWFRQAGNPNDSGLDGWIDAGGNNKYWSSSQKASNPTANQVVGGPCGNQELYCGTAARLDPTPGQSGGVGVAGVDAYLYQVVEADDSDRKLAFFTHWVSHEIEVAEVSIYGGNSADGPWELVWIPFFHTQDRSIRPAAGQGQEDLWEKTEFVETVLAEGFGFYKVEIHARLPEGNATGFKITGIYFSTAQTDEPASESTLSTPEASELPITETLQTTSEPVDPTIVATTGESAAPTAVVETVESGPRATRAARRTQMAKESPIPTVTMTAVPKPSETPTAAVLSTAPGPGATETPRSAPTDSGISTGLLLGGLIVLLLIGGVMIVRLLLQR
jgi:hypothetical protein